MKPYHNNNSHNKNQKETKPHHSKMTRNRGIRGRIVDYVSNHVRECRQTFVKIFATPLQTMMTVLVVGIALAIPSFFLGFISDVKHLSDHLDKEAQISVFLKPNLNDHDLKRLENTLKARTEFEKVFLVSAKDALAEMGNLLQINNLSQALSHNPLPNTFVLIIKPAYQDVSILNPILKTLQTMPEVESVEVDLEWIKKLNSFMNLSKRLVTGVTTLLAFAVLFVIGNTLRLNIENQKEAIEVATLIGATDGFVRRPFLYLGFWYGILGAILSNILVTILNFWIKNPLNQILTLYNAPVLFENLNLNSNVLVLILGMVLGLSAAYFTVARHLRCLRPV